MGLSDIINVCGECFDKNFVDTQLAKDLGVFNKLISECRYKVFNKTIWSIVHGYDMDYIDMLQDFNYLFIVLYTMSQDKFLNGDKGKTYYENKYFLECLKKRFLCYGCNIENVISYFI